jgi:uncharacterized protein
MAETLYAIYSWDSDDAQRLRAEHLAAHLAYAETVIDRIAIGGPLREGDRYFGSLIILQAESETEARAVLEADPYFQAGVWAESEILPFRAVIGEWIGGKSW